MEIMKMSDDEKFEEYKKQVKPVWDGYYDRSIWRTVFSAGSEEGNRAVSALEAEMFLRPKSDKEVRELEQKIINEYRNGHPATFYPSFAQHKPIDKYLDKPLDQCVCLDYGCGSLARYTTEFAKLFKKVIGVDAAPKAIEYCKKYVDGIENIEIVEVDGVTLKEIDDESVDFIFSNLVFQHVGSKEVMINLIEECNRILRPGGFFRASFWTEEKADGYFNVYHGTGFSYEGYKEQFEKAGFKVETMTEDYPVLWVSLSKPK